MSTQFVAAPLPTLSKRLSGDATFAVVLLVLAGALVALSAALDKPVSDGSQDPGAVTYIGP